MHRSPKLEATPPWRLLRRLTTVLFVALVVGLSVFVPGADAQDRMTVTSDTTYRVDVENNQVLVESVYTLRNDVAPVALDDGRTRHRYFTKFGVVIPHSVVQYEARINGLRVQVNFDEREHFDYAESAFEDRLRYGNSTTLTVNYVIPNSGPRADWGDAEINEDFLSFTVWAQGSSGRANVRVLIPSDFEVNLEGRLDGLNQRTGDGMTILEAYGIAQPSDFNGQILGHNVNVAAEETTLDLHSGRAVVLSRPSDPEWRDFIIDALEDDLPVLEELIGIPWPHERIVIEQSNEPRLDGFGGWYEPGVNNIKLDSVNRETLLHEFSHGWFNRDFAHDRWIKEGLAEEIASRAIEATGGERPDPTWPDPADSLRIPLLFWESVDRVDTAAELDVERFHYNASWWVFRQITDDIGTEAFAEVLVEFEATGNPRDEQRNWNTMFDLLDERIEDEKLDELFETYVLAPGSDRLQRRRRVLNQYDALFADSEFVAPLGLRADLRLWHFGEAAWFIGVAQVMMPKLQAVEERAAESSINVLHFRNVFKLADERLELTRLENDIATAMQTLDQIDADRAQTSAGAAELGINLTFEMMPLLTAERNLETTRAAIDNLAADRLSLINDAGDLNVAFTFQPDATIEEAEAELGRLRTRLEEHIERSASIDKRTEKLGLSSAPAASEAQSVEAADRLMDEQASTLDALMTAQESIADFSVSERVGLIGNDLDAELVAARQSFEAGALEQASAQAEAISFAAAGAGDTGKSRLVLSGLMVTVLLFGGAATFAMRGARRRRPLTDRERLESLDAEASSWLPESNSDR